MGNKAKDSQTTKERELSEAFARVRMSETLNETTPLHLHNEKGS